MSAMGFHEGASLIDSGLTLDGLSEEEWVRQQTEVFRANDISNPEDVARRSFFALTHPETLIHYEDVCDELWAGILYD